MEKTHTIEKRTPTEYDILEILENRWSPRAFADTPISETQIRTLLEAGRWAPSSNNLQPWRIIWGAKGSKTYERIFNCLHDFNQGWAGNAQVLWACAFKKDRNDGEKENFHALHDLGLFMGNVLTQAQHMGIAVHQMAGIDYEKAKKEFKFPENYHVATAAAFGYYGGDPDILDDDLKEEELNTERNRKAQDEFAFNGDFQE
jgi:nitroreductase